MTRLGAADLLLVEQAFQNKHGTGWLRADCPVCEQVSGKPDHRQSMGLNTATGGFVCQKCGVTGRLHSRAPDGPPDELPAEQPKVARDIEPCVGYVPIGHGPGASAYATFAARQYAADRGISEQALAEAEIGCTVHGQHHGRLIVPHMLPDGPRTNPWSGWFGRDYTGFSSMKHRYSSGLSRTRLWNEQALQVECIEPVLLVEGCLDALPYWPDACAFLGKPTAAHVELLSKHRGRPVVVALDGDSWEEGWALAQKLKFFGVDAFSVRLPAGEDPSSYRVRL